MDDRPDTDGLTVEDLRRIVALFPQLDGSRKLKDLRVPGLKSAQEFVARVSTTVYPGRTYALYTAIKGVGNALLTAEGRRLLFYARMAADTMRRYRSDEPAPPEKTVSIYCDPSAAAHLLPWAVGDYLPRSGYRYLGVYERDEKEVVAAVGAGVADLGITIAVDPPPGVTRDRLLSADRCVIAHGDYLRRMAEAGTPVAGPADLGAGRPRHLPPRLPPRDRSDRPLPAAGRRRRAGVRGHGQRDVRLGRVRGGGRAGVRERDPGPGRGTTLFAAHFEGLGVEVFLYSRAEERPPELDRLMAAIRDRCRVERARRGELPTAG